MLVLTRKIDEQIKIGDDITITIIKLRNNQIRIGIDAPRDVRVLRGELEPKPESGRAASKAITANNRVTQYIEADADSVNVALAGIASSVRSDSEVHSNVVDGLASADEMIAKGEAASTVAPEPANEKSPDAAGEVSGQPKVRIFSGKIHGSQIQSEHLNRQTAQAPTEPTGGLRVSRDRSPSVRAPLSDFFSAS